MTVSIWRYSHLALALISSLFVLILAVTGVILAFDAVNEKVPSYRVENFNELNLSQVVPELRKVYPEITELTVDHNQFVSINAFDQNGDEVKAYINPTNGKILGKVKTKSQSIQWTTALHRSLFLKETGRIIIGVASFLLLLITISGLVLIIKRQQGIKHFFAKINRDFFAQYFHVITGRIFLIPIFIIALTGTYLFMVRMDLIPKQKVDKVQQKVNENAAQINEAAFPIFKTTLLSDVEKIEFPFIADEPEEFFILKLRDREISVNQINGQVVSTTKYPYSALLEKLSLDWHTGRTSVILAIILGLASLNIVFFIYTGFVITYKRTQTKIKNKFMADQAEIVILVGSENGSTLFFANQIHQQLLADGKSSFIAELNQYRIYPKAKHLIIFTSTYGLGTAPTNGNNFETLLQKYPQQQEIDFSIIGFGSKAYPDYCAYALELADLLTKQTWAKQFLPIHTVNDKSTEEFAKWVKEWSEKSLIALATAPAVYNEKIPNLKKFKVIAKTLVIDDNATFKIILKPLTKLKFRSGDLLAIYPAADHRERFYSIAQVNGKIQLIVKLYEGGFGSSYLYNLKDGDYLKCRVMHNPNFHFPKKAKAVVMIANGTGIAPFLGMILENKKQVQIHLYAGFRFRNVLTKNYQDFASAEINLSRLSSFDIAYSREENAQYVMDLINDDAVKIVNSLANGGVIMICGSLAMQQDVEQVLEKLTMGINNKPLSFYKEQKQIFSDCY
jgi:sulfite reductase (NADPH) flavoprotein alpha-component